MKQYYVVLRLFFCALWCLPLSLATPLSASPLFEVRVKGGHHGPLGAIAGW